MIGYAKKIEKIIRESAFRALGAFDKKKKKPGLKFNSGLALTRVRTTGPSRIRITLCTTDVINKKMGSQDEASSEFLYLNLSFIG